MRVVECTSCRTLAYPGRRVCRRCGGRGFGHREVTEGIIVTYTVIHVVPLDLEPPLIIGVAEFEDGLRALGRLSKPVEIGTRVRAEVDVLRRVDGAEFRGVRLSPLQ